MRVADYIAQRLAEEGITQGFLVTGGGAMHLNDAFGREKKIELLYCHHEQSCSMAAESYGRLTGKPALVNVTSGPGGINALNGVFGAYVDSVPMIVVSGQVKRETLLTSYDLPLRQLGDQEVDIIAMCKSITKSAIQLLDQKDTQYVIEKSLWLSQNGRPGPVWIDVPIDVQATPIDLSVQKSFDPSTEGELCLPKAEQGLLNSDILQRELNLLVERLQNSLRPVILVGSGVRASGMHSQFLQLVEKFKIPVVTAWNAHDALPNENQYYVGRPGTVGDRAGNFAVQNADFLLVLGNRLNIRQIGYDFKSFAEKAFISMIDVDSAELSKPTLHIDQKIHADLRTALPLLLNSEFKNSSKHSDYLAWCIERSCMYPTVLPKYYNPEKPINPYTFIEKLFENLSEDDIIVCGDGTACVVTFQSAILKTGQRLYTNSGCASMGYDLPAAIGAAIANPSRRVICLAGDGSVMMNLQELQTIISNELNVKIVILNNNGYSSIRQTQNNYFSDNIVGCGPESGLNFPDFTKLGTAFGIPSQSHKGLEGLSDCVKDFLESDGYQLLEIYIDSEQPFEPKLSSRQLPDGSMVSGSLSDLAPFLTREELAANTLN